MRKCTTLWLLATLQVAALVSVRGGGIWEERAYLRCIQMPDQCGQLNLAYLGPDAYLTGTIPTEIGRMTRATALLLAANQLSGSLPTELGLLTALTNFRFGHNRLSGSLPTEMGSLTEMVHLHFDNNLLRGSIPTELGRLTSMVALRSANANGLTGSIPTEFGLLTALKCLRLYGNQLTGSMPSDLGRMTALEILLVGDNDMTGSIPTELSQLTLLTQLAFHTNKMTGRAMEQLTQLVQMRQLVMYNNSFSGTIPTELGNMSLLTQLSAGFNRLTGTLPSELGRISLLESFGVMDNDLTGTFPPELFELQALTCWHTLNNQITGTLPLEFVVRVDGSSTRSDNIQVDLWNLPTSPLGRVANITSGPCVDCMMEPPPPPVAAGGRQIPAAREDAKAEDDYTVLLAIVIGSTIAVVSAVALFVMRYRSVGFFRKSVSVSELEFVVQGPDDWSRMVKVEGSSSGSGTQSQPSSEEAPITFWQRVQHHSHSTLGTVTRRGTLPMQRSMVMQLDRLISDLRALVSSERIVNPPQQMTVEVAVMPQDVASVLREERDNRNEQSDSSVPETPSTPSSSSKGWMLFRSSQVGPGSADDDDNPSKPKSQVGPVSADDNDNPSKPPTQSSDPQCQAPVFSPGQRLVLRGRMYLVRKFLSQGNFGAVWLVQDRATSELRVMKVPLRRIDIPLFMKEVELHRSLDSPFIVAFVESFEYDGWPVMVLEACRFGNATAMMAAGRKAGNKMLEESMVSHVMLHVLLGLNYLHSMGVVHRDIKLDNVMVDDALNFKLGDLGSARRTTNMMTTFAGTPVYMAPEVVRRVPYNEKSDIWSLGHLVYEMCSQDLLYNPSTLQSLIAKHKEPYKDIDQSYYSTGLSSTVAWMLTVDPEKRPSASEVLASPYVQRVIQGEVHDRLALRQSIHGGSL